MEDQSVTRPTSSSALLVLYSGLLLFVSAGHACNVPVFRYALERWESDLYTAYVFHKGELNEDSKAAVKFLRDRQADAESSPNLDVQTVDLDATKDEELKGLYGKQKDAELPWVVLAYPFQARLAATAWAGKLTMDSAKAIVDSPSRRETVRRILKGQSSVWVLIESGDKEKDDAAELTLKKQFVELKKVLQLPEQLDYGAAAGPDGATGIPLRLDFSLIRVSRKSPEERVFISMLMNTEEDLHEYVGQPMTFPIFGRGRALYACIGKGINEDIIGEACAFITGACSCQVKEQNPGTDLLLSVTWEEFVWGDIVVDKALPPLSGAGDLIAGTPVDEGTEAEAPVTAGSRTETPSPVATEGEAEPASEAGSATEAIDQKVLAQSKQEELKQSSSLARNLALVGVVFLLLLIAGTLVVRKTG